MPIEWPRPVQAPTPVASNIALNLLHTINFTCGGMQVALDAQRQTFSSLRVPAADIGSFDFVSPPSYGGSHRLGDVTLRVRNHDAQAFMSLSSANNPGAAVPLPAPGTLAAANLTGTLKAPDDLRLTLSRQYACSDAGLEMTYKLHNHGTLPLEVGAFGTAMIFETKDTQGGGRRTLVDLAGNASIVDAAIIGDHGWVSATRMTGTGPVLLVVPASGGAAGSGVENWRRMREASGGLHFELMSHSKAWADNEWVNSSSQFVPPTSRHVAPGGMSLWTFKILLSDSIRQTDDALAAAGAAVIQAVPGYIVATDMTNATLLVRPPSGHTIHAVAPSPASAMTVGVAQPIGSKGFYSIPVRGVTPGRVALAVAFSDGSTTTAAYHVLPPLNEQLSRYGKFASTVAWYSNASDPFGRAPCVHLPHQPHTSPHLMCISSYHPRTTRLLSPSLTRWPPQVCVGI